jgi:hypothetical protein
LSGYDDPYTRRVANLDERAALLVMPRKIRRDLVKVSPNAHLCYVVGLLICDETGVIPKADLVRAERDPRVMTTARRLAKHWGLIT